MSSVTRASCINCFHALLKYEKLKKLWVVKPKESEFGRSTQGDMLLASEYGSCTTADFVVIMAAAGSWSTLRVHVTRVQSTQDDTQLAGQHDGTNEYGSCAAHCTLVARWMQECLMCE